MKAFIFALLIAVALAEEAMVDPINVKCEACKAGVEVIQRFIGNEKSVIESAVSTKCQTLAGQWSQTICPAISFELDNLITLAEAQTRPLQACQAVRLCPKPASDDISFECPACKMVVHWVQKYLGNETSVIEAYVDKECKAVFGKYAPYVCETVEAEIDNIIKYLDQGMTAEQICDLLKLCKKTVAAVDGVDLECPACKMVVHWAQKYLGNETAVIDAYVKKECSAVFGKYAPYVCATVEEKLDDILKYIEMGLTSDEICQLVGLCKSANMKDGCHTEVVCSCCPSKCEVKLVC